MEFILSAIDHDLAEAWQEVCGDLPGVTVAHGNILKVKCDAVVSPANSFGFMDGGIDMVYSMHFGWHVQDRVQEIIKTTYHGELLVGQALVVPTDDPAIPYVIAAPTMRVPLVLSRSVTIVAGKVVRSGVNPYLAARAVLLLLKFGTFPDGPLQGQPIADTIKRIAVPGLGTGIGKVPPMMCARQFRQAFEEVILGQSTFPHDIENAIVRHHDLETGE